LSLRVAYMTGQYPRATDTFIQREVAALRARGVYVKTFSIRKPRDTETVDDAVRAERERTTYVLPAGVGRLMSSHLRLFFASPARYLKAKLLALRTAAPGVKGVLMQLAYFAEAGVVADEMRKGKLVHLHNHFSNSSCTVAMLASALGGFSFSFTMHGPAEFFEPMKWRVDEKIRRALFVSTISEFARSQAMIFAPPDKWDRLHIVHCGVSPKLFDVSTHVGSGKRLLFVGRLANVKGVPVLLDALAIVRRTIPDATLTIAGDGPDRAALEAQAKRLGLDSAVNVLGYQSQSRVRELLMTTDVFAMASFAEGVPVVLMEAMAAGVPVVATRIAGIPELVEDGTSGYLVPPGDAGALSHRIVELLGDPQLRSRFAAEGRRKVEREFDVEVEAAWLCEIMTAALDGKVAPVRRPHESS
jgi:colanic acid/amylovoran biosynthesis glycosyltransferase